MSTPTTSLRRAHCGEYTANPPVLQHRSSTRLPATCRDSHCRFSRWSAKKPVLCAPGRVGAELHAVLGDDGRRDRLAAAAAPGPEVEAFLLLHVLVGERVQAAARELRAQRFVDPLAVAVHAGGEELHHQQVAVTVHHQPGQAVALAVDHAPGI
jgi:hypothetical protein